MRLALVVLGLLVFSLAWVTAACTLGYQRDVARHDLAVARDSLRAALKTQLPDARAAYVSSGNYTYVVDVDCERVNRTNLRLIEDNRRLALENDSLRYNRRGWSVWTHDTVSAR